MGGFSGWTTLWLTALRSCFSNEWTVVAGELGNGLRELLKLRSDFDHAYDSCMNGLLSSVTTTKDELRANAERLPADAIKSVEMIAREQ